MEVKEKSRTVRKSYFYLEESLLYVKSHCVKEIQEVINFFKLQPLSITSIGIRIKL